MENIIFEADVKTPQIFAHCVLDVWVGHLIFIKLVILCMLLPWINLQ